VRLHPQSQISGYATAKNIFSRNIEIKLYCNEKIKRHFYPIFFSGAEKGWEPLLQSISLIWTSKIWLNLLLVVWF